MPSHTPPHTPAAGPPAKTTAPRLPSQGHTAADDDNNIPAAPGQPDGDYIVRFNRVHFWTDRDGNPAMMKNGKARAPSVYLIIDDPKEQRLMNAGKEHCYGQEIDFGLDFEGFRYQQTAAYCATLGTPQKMWPKTKTELAALLGVNAKGKRFVVNIKPEDGTGEHKGKVFTRLKSLKAAPVVAKPTPAPVIVAPPPIEEPAEDDEVNTVLPGDAEQPAEGA